MLGLMNRTRRTLTLTALLSGVAAAGAITDCP